MLWLKSKTKQNDFDNIILELGAVIQNKQEMTKRKLEEILSSEINFFINKVHKSTLDTRLLSDIINALISFSLLVIVTSFMLKSPTLFRRKKGFKFGECLKISLTSAIPAFLFGILSFLLLGIDFAVAMGFIYLIRIVYIYIKYFFSNKNNIYARLYESTGEERFKLK